MNLRDLEAFVAVVETGSIMAASARLNLTQPGVTRRIQNLEQVLDAELLDRQSKPFKPTAAGRDAYEHARRMIGSLEDLKARLRPAGDVRGECRLGVTPHLSELSLLRPLDHLRDEFPHLTLKIASGWSPRLIEQVARSELDAAVIALPDGVPLREGLVGEDLGTQRVLVVAASTLGVPKAPTIEALSAFPWVVNENGCGFRDYIRHSFEATRLPFNTAVEVMSSDLRMSLVARGLGVGIVTPAALADSPWKDAVEIIRVHGFAPTVRCWAIHRAPAGRLNRPITTFAASIRAELAATAA